MNKQIELFKAGIPNVRVYVNTEFYDGITVVWPYKSGFSDLGQDGAICEHFEGTKNHSVYHNPVDRPKYKWLGKRTKFEDLDERVKQSILYLFPLIWDL